MDMELFMEEMRINMKENGKMIKEMDWEFIIIIKEKYMLEIGKMDLEMDMVNLLHKTE